MLPSDVPIYVATETIDMRWSFDILAGVVRERLGEEPRSGALFVFFGRRFDGMKVLFFDQTGYAAPSTFLQPPRARGASWWTKRSWPCCSRAWTCPSVRATSGAPCIEPSAHKPTK